MNKGQEYRYSSIEQWAYDNDFNIEENGVERMGEHFLTLSHKYKDQVISFVMTGATMRESVYECVYSDLGQI